MPKGKAAAVCILLIALTQSSPLSHYQSHYTDNRFVNVYFMAAPKNLESVFDIHQGAFSSAKYKSLICDLSSNSSAENCSPWSSSGELWPEILQW